MLEKQKKEDGTCYVSTVLFSNDSKVLHDRLPLEQVKPMTGRDYYVGGCTALLDAIGGAIRHISNIHKYARPEDVPGQTLFVITTDGMENASRRYGAEEVRRLIAEKKATGWEFLFLAANIDAVQTAKHFGISEDRAVNYHADSKGTRVVYEAVSEAVCNVRRQAPLAATWSEKVNEDYKQRKS